MSGISQGFALAGMAAVSLSTSAALAESGERANYAPIQSIRYDFGSKSVSGYFFERGVTCVVTLMVYEKTDPEIALPPSATRVRLVLNPGQIAGLDSEEGRSLNFTCGESATTLLVEAGERKRLVGLQGLMLRRTAGE